MKCPGREHHLNYTPARGTAKKYIDATESAITAHLHLEREVTECVQTILTFELISGYTKNH